MLKHEPQRAFGTNIINGTVCFRLWAPNQELVSLVLDGGSPVPMGNAENGWHELTCPVSKAGTLYKFALENGLEVPDPASRFQPGDVHGPSEVINPDSYDWKDADWTGRCWEECVIYELHVGAFTQRGTFLAATERLDYLQDLGITAIELMPS